MKEVRLMCQLVEHREFDGVYEGMPLDAAHIGSGVGQNYRVMLSGQVLSLWCWRSRQWFTTTPYSAQSRDFISEFGEYVELEELSGRTLWHVVYFGYPATVVGRMGVTTTERELR
jgi:hypothetical protein